MSASPHQASKQGHPSGEYEEHVIAGRSSSPSLGPDLQPCEEVWDDRHYNAYDVEAFMRTVLSLDLPSAEKT